MAKQRETHEQGREERKHDEDHKERHREPHGTGYGTERSVYLDYLARKWQGSSPPTPQAYARAIQLWRQLPGAIMTAPTDLGKRPETGSGDDGKAPSQKNDLHERRGS